MSTPLQSLAWAHIEEILHLPTEGIPVHVVYVAETALTGVHYLKGICEPLVPTVHLAAAFVAIFVK